MKTSKLSFKRILFLFTLLFNSGLLSAQWSWVSPLPQGNTLMDIAFINADTGFAVGNKGTIIRTLNAGLDWTVIESNTQENLSSVFFVNDTLGYACGYNGTIIKTTDGGDNWMLLPSSSTNALVGIWFLDVNTGFVVGNLGTLLKTTNGGNTWVSINMGTTKAINTLWFQNPQIIYAAGWQSALLKSTNGGQNWTELNSGIGSGWYFNDFYFTSADTGFVVGAAGYILRTTNAGSTWTPMNSSVTGAISAIWFTSSQTGFATTNGGGFGKIIKTTDGGLNWSVIESSKAMAYYNLEITSNAAYVCGIAGVMKKSSDNWLTQSSTSIVTPNILNSICFSAGQTAFIAGKNGTLLQSTDDGNTWNTINCGVSTDLESVCFTDQMNGYIGTTGKILKTTDGGLTWTSVNTGANEAMRCINFINADTGFAAGLFSVLRTTDAGNTWNIFFNNPSGLLPSSIRDMHFITAAKGFISAGFGTILRTLDGGNTWTKISIPGVTTTLSSISFPDTLTGYIAGESNILKTTDGGISWINMGPLTYPLTISTIYFIDAQNGFISNNSGVIARTSDGAQSWIIENTMTDNVIYSFAKSNSDEIIAVGLFGLIVKRESPAALKGELLYQNISNTPFTSCIVNLCDTSGTVISSSTTNGNGEFTFYFVNPGNYKIIPNCNKTWGGGNAVDALQILKHFTGMTLLQGLNFTAADVNADNSVNSVDALLVASRFVGLINQFQSSDWTFETTIYTVTEGQTTDITLHGLCTGDTDGSFIPY